VPKLLDFGIAKLLSGDARPAATTIHALTPEFASPEQVLGRSVGTGSDVYSLGVLLFLILAGRTPYRAQPAQAADFITAVAEDEPAWHPPGLIHGDLQSILAQALRKEPERRYLSVEQFAADLRRYIDGRPVSARPDSMGYRARKFVGRRAVPLAAALALFVAIVTGIVSTLFQSRRAERRFNDVRSLAHSILFDIYDAIDDLPGSVAARRLVVGRAQQYLDSLASEAADDPALTRELAESYLRLGDVRGRPYTANLGDTIGALESYRKALALLERESSRHPADVAVQEKLTEAYMNVGVILMRQNQTDGSMAAAKQAIGIAQQLSDRYPHNVVYREKLAHAHMRLGQAQHVAAHRSGAIAAYQQVLETYQRAIAVLQADGPHDEDFWRARLATLHFYVGYPLRDLGEHTGNLQYYKDALESAIQGNALNHQNVAANPSDVAPMRRLADGLVDLGNIRWKCCRDLDGSLRDLDEGLEGFQKIVDRDAHNLEARRDVANVHNARSLVLSEARRNGEALDAAHRALGMYEQLALADPASAENARVLAEVRARVAALEREPR
jgi:tetratricopeptide (TPR) repeat protein